MYKTHIAILLSLLILVQPAVTAETNAERGAKEEVEQRLLAASRYLASDELEGRGIGTPGIDKAARYISDEFSRLGLVTSLYEGEPFQSFEVTASTEMGPAEENYLELVGPPAEEGGLPQRIALKLNEQYGPLAVGGSGQIDAPLVFGGYGISAENLDYDDYAGIDVKGKAVLLLRKEPQQDNPHSVFNGTEPSRHAWFTTKVSNAFQHGAAAVLLVNDHFDVARRAREQRQSWHSLVEELATARDEFERLSDPTVERFAEYRAKVEKVAAQIQKLGESMDAGFDQLVGFHGAGESSSGDRMPVVFCRRDALDPVVRSALDTDLTAIESGIDRQLEPYSRPLDGWRVRGIVRIIRRRAEIKNVIGVLDGAGDLAKQTIVVGAHYDHLGYGGRGNSLAPWTKAIHNGADDNASGVAVLLEVAGRLAARDDANRRRIVFIAFTGEERGLLGSAHYVRQPSFPLEQTVAMVNLDMVGRLRDDKLIVHGTGTAANFDGLIDAAAEPLEFRVKKEPGGFGPSDHSSFYAKEIPVLAFFTGSHRDYHRPSDDVEKLNVAGMRRVARLVTDVVAQLAVADQRPEYREIARRHVARGGTRPYFGSIPDFGREASGYALMDVTKGGPADRAGIQGGDVVIQFGESKIGGLDDFDSALRNYKSGDKVSVVVQRGEQELTFTVTLDPPR